MTREPRPIALALLRSPLGWVGLAADGACLCEVVLHPDPGEVRRRLRERYPRARHGRSGVLEAACRQLGEYFRGDRRTFDLPLDPGAVPPFTAAVRRALAAVPFGQTVTYGELAARAGRPGAARAVGRVMATNPLPIVLPCHRVVGAGGELTGYSGGEGVATKAWLLRFETATAEKEAGT